MKLLLVFLATLIIFSGLIGCGSRDDKSSVLSALREEPEISVFSPQDSFVVVDASEQIGGLQIGRVIVKRQSDNTLFAAIIPSSRKFNKGEQINIVHISYMHNSETSTEFLAVGK